MIIRTEELFEKSNKRVDEAIEQIGNVLNEVQLLDSIIKENQVREFKKQWRDVFNFEENVNPELKFENEEFKNRFKYLINRMNAENQIKERIIEISNKAIKEVEELWNNKK